MVYATQLVKYFFYTDDDVQGIETIYGIFCFWMTNVFGMLISFSLLPLSMRIIFQMYNNVTSIEMGRGV